MVRVWDRASGQVTAALTGHAGGVRAVAIAPDGTWLATASEDGAVRVWDRASGQTVTLMRTDGPLYACAWASDGRSLALGGARGPYLFDWHPGTERPPETPMTAARK
jgi:WD40 repeat protein